MIKILRALALLATLGLSGACSFYSTQKEGPSLTQTVFDSRLPDAIEDFFSTCHDDYLQILHSAKQINLLGSCRITQEMPTDQVELIVTAIATDPILAIDIPSKLYDERGSFADFPWPLQNCFVEWDTEVYFYAIAFDSLSASWVERSGGPALKIRFSNPELSGNNHYRPATWSTIATAHCPSQINQGLVREKLDASGVNGSGDVNLRDMDLDLFYVFTEENEKIAVDLEIEPQIKGLDLGIKWNKLPAAAEKSFNKVDDLLADEMGGVVETLLGGFTPSVEQQFALAVPAGHEICWLKIVNGKLILMTDEPGPRSCERRTPGGG